MNDNNSFGPYPSRLVLDGIPHIGFDKHLSPFPGSLFAILEYLHDPRDYDYLMGVTGAAFRRLWNRDDGGNIDLSKLGEKPFKLVFEALGYDWITVPPEKKVLIAAAQESLARGVPPISFGVFGPPEAGIVTGYDQDGAVLYGWSYFQTDGSHYYKKNDWFETMEIGDVKGWIILKGRKSTIPSEREVFINSLELALDLECSSTRPETPNHINGLAAYDGWANALEEDSSYPPDNTELLSTRAMIHADQCTMIMERREGARFLRRMKATAPEASGYLEDAAVHYDQVADLVTTLWPWPYDNYDVATRALSDPQQRRLIAENIRKAKEKEAQAVTCLDKAFAVLK